MSCPRCRAQHDEINSIVRDLLSESPHAVTRMVFDIIKEMLEEVREKRREAKRREVETFIDSVLRDLEREAAQKAEGI